MEVHHAHHPTHKKKLSEYLLEFFMLFFAVTLGFFAENIREHYVEKHKAIVSVQNLYKDLKEDSSNYVTLIKSRKRQDSCFEIISHLYDEKKLAKEVATVYAAHAFIAKRIMPIMNTMALDQIKNSGQLNFIEDDKLKETIQLYASDANGLKLREQREFSFLDKMVDPITINRFEYKFFQQISLDDNFKIVADKIYIKIQIPVGLKIIKANTFDLENYLSILGMLRTIRKSTDKSYTLPTQKLCYKLLEIVRNYLKENNALID
jgi:hypothetical protein